MRARLKAIVEQSNTPASRYFDVLVQVLIILSMVLFTLETVPEFEPLLWYFQFAEYVIVILFTIEYLARVLVADSKLGYIFSFYGIIDLLSILPFYLTLGVADVRFVRIFRLFRLLRLFKLTRYSRAMGRLQRAVNKVREELILYGAFTLLLVYLASIGIYHFENEAQPEVFRSVIDSMWWAIATLTTVGYGDVYPVTIGGKLFTFLILLIGLGFVSVPSALLAASLSEEFKSKTDEESLQNGTSGF